MKLEKSSLSWEGKRNRPQELRLHLPLVACARHDVSRKLQKVDLHLQL